jgi:hypothetical protein
MIAFTEPCRHSIPIPISNLNHQQVFQEAEGGSANNNLTVTKDNGKIVEYLV